MRSQKPVVPNGPCSTAHVQSRNETNKSYRVDPTNHRAKILRISKAQSLCRVCSSLAYARHRRVDWLGARMPTEKININQKRGRTVLKCCSDSELLKKIWNGSRPRSARRHELTWKRRSRPGMSWIMGWTMNWLERNGVSLFNHGHRGIDSSDSPNDRSLP